MRKGDDRVIVPLDRPQGFVDSLKEAKRLMAKWRKSRNNPFWARVVRLDETKTVMAESRPAHPARKESTVKGTLKAFKTIVNHFTPPGYTRRKSPKRV